MGSIFSRLFSRKDSSSSSKKKLSKRSTLPRPERPDDGTTQLGPRYATLPAPRRTPNETYKPQPIAPQNVSQSNEKEARALHTAAAEIPATEEHQTAVLEQITPTVMARQETTPRQTDQHAEKDILPQLENRLIEGTENKASNEEITREVPHEDDHTGHIGRSLGEEITQKQQDAHFEAKEAEHKETPVSDTQPTGEYEYVGDIRHSNEATEQEPVRSFEEELRSTCEPVVHAEPATESIAAGGEENATIKLDEKYVIYQKPVELAETLFSAREPLDVTEETDKQHPMEVDHTSEVMQPDEITEQEPPGSFETEVQSSFEPVVLAEPVTDSITSGQDLDGIAREDETSAFSKHAEGQEQDPFIATESAVAMEEPNIELSKCADYPDDSGQVEEVTGQELAETYNDDVQATFVPAVYTNPVTDSATTDGDSSQVAIEDKPRAFVEHLEEHLPNEFGKLDVTEKPDMYELTEADHASDALQPEEVIKRESAESFEEEVQGTYEPVVLAEPVTESIAFGEESDVITKEDETHTFSEQPVEPTEDLFETREPANVPQETGVDQPTEVDHTSDAMHLDEIPDQVPAGSVEDEVQETVESVVHAEPVTDFPATAEESAGPETKEETHALLEYPDEQAKDPFEAIDVNEEPDMHQPKHIDFSSESGQPDVTIEQDLTQSVVEDTQDTPVVGDESVTDFTAISEDSGAPAAEDVTQALPEQPVEQTKDSVDAEEPFDVIEETDVHQPDAIQPDEVNQQEPAESFEETVRETFESVVLAEPVPNSIAIVKEDETHAFPEHLDEHAEDLFDVKEPVDVTEEPEVQQAKDTDYTNEEMQQGEALKPEMTESVDDEVQGTFEPVVGDEQLTSEDSSALVAEEVSHALLEQPVEQVEHRIDESKPLGVTEESDVLNADHTNDPFESDVIANVEPVESYQGDMQITFEPVAQAEPATDFTSMEGESGAGLSENGAEDLAEQLVESAAVSSTADFSVDEAKEQSSTNLEDSSDTYNVDVNNSTQPVDNESHAIVGDTLPLPTSVNLDDCSSDQLITDSDHDFQLHATNGNVFPSQVTEVNGFNSLNGNLDEPSKLAKPFSPNESDSSASHYIPPDTLYSSGPPDPDRIQEEYNSTTD